MTPHAHRPAARRTDRRAALIVGFTALWLAFVYLAGWTDAFGMRLDRSEERAAATTTPAAAATTTPAAPTLDRADYDRRMALMANCPAPAGTSTPPCLWPVPNLPYPKPGAILPFNRIIAYYGNFYSTRMGVLGEYPEDEMIAMLRREQERWEAADPETPTVPAINYIASTAQSEPGREGLYTLRMPDSQIDRALELADKVDGIVILDIQIGFSDLERELPLLEKYLAMPNVHLGLDPEFHMIGPEPPGEVIGSYDAKDINFAAEYLADLVRKHDLPPKVLIVHRFTERMVTNYRNIRPLPEVQVVIDMDGWGPPAKKINTYRQFVAPQPVQFTGFKIFYKNDLKPPSDRLLTPEDLLRLTPRPLFIQYQ